MRNEGIAEVRGQIAEVKPFLQLLPLQSDLCNVSMIE